MTPRSRSPSRGFALSLACIALAAPACAPPLDDTDAVTNEGHLDSALPLPPADVVGHWLEANPGEGHIATEDIDLRADGTYRRVSASLPFWPAGDEIGTWAATAEPMGTRVRLTQTGGVTRGASQFLAIRGRTGDRLFDERNEPNDTIELFAPGWPIATVHGKRMIRASAPTSVIGTVKVGESRIFRWHGGWSSPTWSVVRIDGNDGRPLLVRVEAVEGRFIHAGFVDEAAPLPLEGFRVQRSDWHAPPPFPGATKQGSRATTEATLYGASAVAVSVDEGVLRRGTARVRVTVKLADEAPSAPPLPEWLTLAASSGVAPVHVTRHASGAYVLDLPTPCIRSSYPASGIAVRPDGTGGYSGGFGDYLSWRSFAFATVRPESDGTFSVRAESTDAYGERRTSGNPYRDGVPCFSDLQGRSVKD